MKSPRQPGAAPAQFSSALVIEHDPFVRAGLLAQLRELGVADVRVAADGASARALLAGAHYDVIVCDLKMPGEKQGEFLRAIAQVQSNAVIVILGSVDEATLRAVGPLCRERGLRVIGGMGKPLRSESLRNLLAQLAAPAAAPGAEHGVTVGDIERAIRHGAIGARVQPMVSVAGGELRCAEFLADWSDRQLGPVPPQELIAIADASGIVRSLNDYLVAVAVRTAGVWRAAGLTLPIAVNVSAGALHDPELPRLVEGLLRVAGVPPAHLRVEVSETTLAGQAPPLDVLAALRALGVGVTLDNVGAEPGYRLAKLDGLPISGIKIDRQLIGRLPLEPRAIETVRRTLRLAGSLGLETTAVGVETAAQAELLASLGCELLQGYWIARPMAPEQLPGWSAARSP
ncbi:MAG TPA: EAL domain-containing response regulator [Candidatus Binatia bacterium]|nr:EAL domain-containing response regulator [Candidatus Binatia bacterium]